MSDIFPLRDLSRNWTSDITDIFRRGNRLEAALRRDTTAATKALTDLNQTLATSIASFRTYQTVTDSNLLLLQNHVNQLRDMAIQQHPGGEDGDLQRLALALAEPVLRNSPPQEAPRVQNPSSIPQNPNSDSQQALRPAPPQALDEHHPVIPDADDDPEAAPVNMLTIKTSGNQTLVPFTGATNQNFNDWLLKLEDEADLNTQVLSDAQKLKFLRRHLDGSARKEFQRYHEELGENLNYAVAIDRLRTKYQNRNHTVLARQELHNTKKTANESAADFLERLRNVIDRAYYGESAAYIERRTYDEFCSRVSPAERLQIQTTNAETLDDAVRAASQMECYLASRQQADSSPPLLAQMMESVSITDRSRNGVRSDFRQKSSYADSRDGSRRDRYDRYYRDNYRRRDSTSPRRNDWRSPSRERPSYGNSEWRRNSDDRRSSGYRDRPYRYDRSHSNERTRQYSPYRRDSSRDRHSDYRPNRFSNFRSNYSDRNSGYRREFSRDGTDFQPNRPRSRTPDRKVHFRDQTPIRAVQCVPNPPPAPTPISEPTSLSTVEREELEALRAITTRPRTTTLPLKALLLLSITFIYLVKPSSAMSPLLCDWQQSPMFFRLPNSPACPSTDHRIPSFHLRLRLYAVVTTPRPLNATRCRLIRSSVETLTDLLGAQFSRNLIETEIPLEADECRQMHAQHLCRHGSLIQRSDYFQTNNTLVRDASWNPFKASTWRRSEIVNCVLDSTLLFHDPSDLRLRHPESDLSPNCRLYDGVCHSDKGAVFLWDRQNATDCAFEPTASHDGIRTDNDWMADDADIAVTIANATTFQDCGRTLLQSTQGPAVLASEWTANSRSKRHNADIRRSSLVFSDDLSIRLSATEIHLMKIQRRAIRTLCANLQTLHSLFNVALYANPALTARAILQSPLLDARPIGNQTFMAVPCTPIPAERIRFRSQTSEEHHIPVSVFIDNHWISAKLDSQTHIVVHPNATTSRLDVILFNDVFYKRFNATQWASFQPLVTQLPPLSNFTWSSIQTLLKPRTLNDWTLREYHGLVTDVAADHHHHRLNSPFAQVPSTESHFGMPIYMPFFSLHFPQLSPFEWWLSLCGAYVTLQLAGNIAAMLIVGHLIPLLDRLSVATRPLQFFRQPPPPPYAPPHPDPHPFRLPVPDAFQFPPRN